MVPADSMWRGLFQASRRMAAAKLLHQIALCLAFLICLVPGLPSQTRANLEELAQQAEALLTLSERQNYENHAQALDTARQALELWQSAADADGMARAYAMIGRCHLAQNDLPEATENYEKALHLWRELNNLAEQASALIQFSFIENRKGEWGNSISFLTQAQSLIDENQEPAQMGRIASVLGDLFNENGLPESGLAQYQRALDCFRQTPDTRDDAMTIIELGQANYLMGNYPEALNYLLPALAGFAADSIDAAHCSEYLGRVYRAMGNVVVALPYLQSALTVYTRTGNPQEAAQVQALMGECHQQLGSLELARRHYRQALAAFNKLSDRVNQAATYYALGRLELQQQNLSRAEEYLRQSIQITEQLRRVPTSRDLTAAFSATVSNRYEGYIECLMRQHEAHPEQGFVVRAFEMSESARARSLAELLQATGTNLTAGLDPQLAAREKALRQQIRIKEDDRVTLLSRSYSQNEMVGLEAELTRLEEDYKQVERRLRDRYPAYAEMTNSEGWDLQKIQEQVIADDQTVLLEYSLGSERSYVWVVTRDRIVSYPLPARARINEAAQRVYQLLATPPGADTAERLSAAVEDLNRMILLPVAAELNKSRILIVADGALHYIPFQMLPNPLADNQPLVANYEIINAPSASILGALRREAEQRQPATGIAAFGDPVFAANYAQRKEAAGGEQSAAMQAWEIGRWHQALRDLELNGEAFDPSVLQPLFYAKRELANLRSVEAGGDPFIASGFAATREQLLSADLTRYAILHFATHGLLDPKRPENSGLVLSTINREGQTQNGFVGLQDIYGLRAPVDLVVLSACQTALGKEVRGEGLIGITRGFMYAGASSVMASLWKVNDEATAELMRYSYSNMLQKGMTPAAALRAAQNSLRQRPEWQSPYYWAGFTLQGEYRRVIQPAAPASASERYRQVITIGALTLLLGILCWYGYRKLPRPQAAK